MTHTCRFCVLAMCLLLLAAPAVAQGTGVKIGGRDFRQGDGAWTRQQRVLNGTDLRTRNRLARQEILIEQRQDRSDEARWRRENGQIDIQSQDFGQRLDTGAARRQDRASVAEQSAQKRAPAIRRELAARQHAERQRSSADRDDR